MAVQVAHGVFSPFLLFLTVCFVLQRWVCVDQVTGYFLKSCFIREDVGMTVHCTGMKLGTIPQDIPHTARFLDVSRNYIPLVKKSDLKNLSSLKAFYISNNFIYDLERGAFKDLVALEELNLAHNRLNNLSGHFFRGLVNLTVLRLDNNNIGSIEFSAFSLLHNMKALNLSKNGLQRIEEVQPVFFHLPHLQELYVGSNNFSSFQSQEVSNTSLKLKVLDLSRNPLEVFRITANVFPHLEMLDLAFSGQNGSMVWDVQDGYYLRSVSRLDLSGIPIAVGEMTTVLQTVNTSLVNLSLNNLGEEKVKPLIDSACQILTLKGFHFQNNNFSSPALQLQSCSRVTTLDLSHNRFYSVPCAIKNIPTLETLDLSSNAIISLRCLDFANLTQLIVLNLVKNAITTLNNCVFQHLLNLERLMFGGNTILSLAGVFQRSLLKLKSLGMESNKLRYIKKGDLRDLQSLTDLEINDNQIMSIEEGAFEGLSNLRELNLQSNKITQSSIRASVFTELPNLKHLYLNNNYITYANYSRLKPAPFSKLASLESLDIFSQGHRGMFNLPSNFLEGLTSLQTFSAGNLKIRYLHPDTFIHNPHLSNLSLSKNELIALTPEVFWPLKKLNMLFLSKVRLQSLDFLIQGNLTQVRQLAIKMNELTVINEMMMHALPSLTLLQLQGNAFTCDCSNAWFIGWAKSNMSTQVVSADEFNCSYPPILKGTKLLDLNIALCNVDVGLFYFISTSSLVLLTVLSSLFYCFLRWQVVYAYYLFLAFLYDGKVRRTSSRSGFQYDAFVSYNTHDELWVMRELLPQLEGEQGWRLCLHHRDFEPGKPIIDNIVGSIYGSRKTICVISRRYLESEWCSREIQVASFRLFDEKKDVLILVFLEDIPAHQLSPYHRMRRLVKKRTYLSWPKPGGDARVFWQKLRVALGTRESAEEENPILSGVKRI